MYDEDEDIELEDCGSLETMVTVTQDYISVQLPEVPEIVMKKVDLIMAVENPHLLERFAISDEQAEFYNHLFPCVLEIAEEKEELYSKLGFTKW